jgi:hypothetical protein
MKRFLPCILRKKNLTRNIFISFANDLKGMPNRDSLFLFNNHISSLSYSNVRVLSFKKKRKNEIENSINSPHFTYVNEDLFIFALLYQTKL